MNKIPVNTHFGMAFINVNDIVAMNSLDGNTEIIKSDGTKLVIYEPLKKFEVFNFNNLFRTHRSWIVNLDRIEKLYCKGNCFLIASCDKKNENGSLIEIRVDVSRRKLPEIKKKFLNQIS